MAKINLNELAKDVSAVEGGKVNLPIAQIKEVVKQTLLALQAEWKDGNEVGVVQAIVDAK